MLTNALSGKSSSFNGHRRAAGREVARARGQDGSGRKVTAFPRLRGGIDSEPVSSFVAVSPAHRARQHSVRWSGMAAEIVQAIGTERSDYHYCGPRYLLVLFERLVRRNGITSVDGLPASSLRDLTRKLIVVPPGTNFTHWHEAKNGGRVIFFYFDAAALPLDGEAAGRARLFFEDAALISTAEKLASVVESAQSGSTDYLEALGRVLAHELVRSQQGPVRTKETLRGGLAPWQQRVVTAYIEEHLAESIPLAALARLAGLSAYHFCRAFKQSFGLPPHRYHTSRRIAHAKMLLAKPSVSVTDVGMKVGFAETSSFSAAFRKVTGVTPSAYHRGLA